MTLVFKVIRTNLNTELIRNGAKMKDSFSWLTPKQAAQLVGYTPRHIQNLISQGRLSATKEDGKYYIEKSEFFRVFPKAYNKEQEGNNAQQFTGKERLEFENTMLKDVSSDKDKEIEFLRSQVEFISHEKIKMLDAILYTTKLLEHKNDKKPENDSLIQKLNWKKIFSFK